MLPLNDNNVFPPLRRSSRAREHLSGRDIIVPYLKVIRLSVSIIYPISHHLSYSNFSPSYQSFVAAISSISEPRFYHDVIRDYIWQKAMAGMHTIMPWSLSLCKERLTTFYNLNGLCGWHRHYRELWGVDCGFETVLTLWIVDLRSWQVEAFFGWLKLLDHLCQSTHICFGTYWGYWCGSNIKSWQLQNWIL